MARRISFLISLFIILIVFSVGRSFTQEQATTGLGLIGSCQISIRSMEDKSYHENTFDAWRDGYCSGIVQGVSNASPHVCPDAEVTVGQEKRVVLKFLQDHPEELHLDNAELIERALARAFPCKNK